MESTLKSELSRVNTRRSSDRPPPAVNWSGQGPEDTYDISTVGAKEPHRITCGSGGALIRWLSLPLGSGEDARGQQLNTVNGGYDPELSRAHLIPKTLGGKGKRKNWVPLSTDANQVQVHSYEKRMSEILTHKSQAAKGGKVREGIANITEYKHLSPGTDTKCKGKVDWKTWDICTKDGQYVLENEATGSVSSEVTAKG